MAKYRLTAKHYWRDELLLEGTLVGDGTPHAVPPEGPTFDMEPLDDEAQAEVDKLHETTTKALAAAPQVGLLYLQPETQEALNQLLGTTKMQDKAHVKPAMAAPAPVHKPAPVEHKPAPENKGK